MPDKRLPKRSGPIARGNRQAGVLDTATLAHFGLDRDPFSEWADPNSRYTNAARRKLYNAFLAAILEQPGVFVLTGDKGVGKTARLRSVQQELMRAGYLLIPPLHGALPFSSVLAAVAKALALFDPAHDSADRAIQTIHETLKTCPPAILVIDSAEQIGYDVIAKLPRLIFAPGSRDARLRVLLIGTTGFLERQDLRAANDLIAAITYRCSLEGLTDEDVSDFLLQQLRNAGSRHPDLFAPSAVKSLVGHARGLPRRVILLAERSLVLTRRAGVTVVTVDMVERAAREMFPSSPPTAVVARPAPLRLPWSVKMFAARVTTTVALGVSATAALFRSALRPTGFTHQVLGAGNAIRAAVHAVSRRDPQQLRGFVVTAIATACIQLRNALEAFFQTRTQAHHHRGRSGTRTRHRSRRTGRSAQPSAAAMASALARGAVRAAALLITR
jgi:type II secretory pathway predicted ATPase ExeA